MAALVLANALIFQEQLAATESRVEPLDKLDSDPDLLTVLRQHWRWIGPSTTP